MANESKSYIAHPKKSPKQLAQSYIKYPSPLMARAATAWRVADLCAAYNVPKNGCLGGGVIGILELGGGFTQADLDLFSQKNGLPPIVVNVVPVAGGANQPGGDDDGEVLLDIQVAAATFFFATGAMPTINVFFAPNAFDSFEAIVNAAVAAGCDVLSISFGTDEKKWIQAAPGTAEKLDVVIANAAQNNGLVVFAASGDNSSGDSNTGANVNMPSACPHVIACGGTKKMPSGKEIVWGVAGDSSGQGTGGGYSNIFPMPLWQSGNGAPPDPEGTSARMVPDVAANAAPATGYLVVIDGVEQPVGGTSAVAPLYAGLFAAFGKKLGFVGPVLWQNHQAFTDITEGSNGQFFAQVGPDPCTGLGVPNGAVLLNLFSGGPGAASAAKSVRARSSAGSSSPAPIKSTASISLPEDFVFGAVDPAPSAAHALDVAPPSLGPLANFVGTWTGGGFNTIFRPDNAKSASSMKLPIPLPPGDNLLELNLTSETLTFSQSLGSVPNRGSATQADAFLNGVPYLQTINDVTTPEQAVGIHVEPGIWIMVPATTAPAEGPTVVRMASIPHGTTIEAQGTFSTAPGTPNIPVVDITPFSTPATGIPSDPQPGKIKFPSQTAADNKTARIPQDLSAFIASGTLTQAMLDDPNSVIRNQISQQTILETTTISVSTQPASPPVISGGPTFGGGADNIAFLLGDGAQPVAAKPNAQVLQMTATFWIETVEYTIEVPIFTPGQLPLILKPNTTFPGRLVPTFSVTPPTYITAPLQIKVTSTQIQYSQLVLLNFNGLTWPHVSVATLVPAEPITVPASAF